MSRGSHSHAAIEHSPGAHSFHPPHSVSGAHVQFLANGWACTVMWRDAMSHDAYLPAAGRDFLLPFYDPLVKLLGADRARKKLFDQAKVQPQHRVLDIGCGTGTFAVALKGWLPTLGVVGLDPDPKALAKCRRKAARMGA